MHSLKNNIFYLLNIDMKKKGWIILICIIVIILLAIIGWYYYSRYQCTHYICEEYSGAEEIEVKCDFKSIIIGKYKCIYYMPMLPDVIFD